MGITEAGELYGESEEAGERGEGDGSRCGQKQGDEPVDGDGPEHRPAAVFPEEEGQVQKRHAPDDAGEHCRKGKDRAGCAALKMDRRGQEWLPWPQSKPRGIQTVPRRFAIEGSSTGVFSERNSGHAGDLARGSLPAQSASGSYKEA